MLTGTILEQEPSWPQEFWRQCLRDTPCEPAHIVAGTESVRLGTTGGRVRDVRRALAAHYQGTLTTTETDARHDGAFGIAGLALSVLEELLTLGNSTHILGQTGLRSLLEHFVTLDYLAKRDDPDQWRAYRTYGAGQAKLAFLKLDEISQDLPSYVDVRVLERFANEDQWQEFLAIELGQWAHSDLRKMSEEVGAKDQYDRYYPWTSAFVHGSWAAVRSTTFDTCLNPLHRLHLVLRSSTAVLGDVVPDACLLLDGILAMVDRLYPAFPSRVAVE